MDKQTESWRSEVTSPVHLGPGGGAAPNQSLSPISPSFVLSFLFLFGGAACGILVPRPGIEPAPLAVRARSPNHWTARELLPSHPLAITMQNMVAPGGVCGAPTGGLYTLPSLRQVFWLTGSLLIIGLASMVIPTIGWRWLIRITSIPGIVLTVAFMVTKLMGSLLASPPAGPVALLPHTYLSHVHLSPYVSICLSRRTWKGCFGRVNAQALSRRCECRICLGESRQAGMAGVWGAGGRPAGKTGLCADYKGP